MTRFVSLLYYLLMVGVAVRHSTAGLARVVSWLCTDTELTILPELLFPCFALLSRWPRLGRLRLEAAKVPEAARQKLIQLGYETQDAFNFDDDDTFKAFMKQFSVGGMEARWSY